ncbi:hypothetical protein ACLOJK_002682 [Asimina triloba]
MRSGGLSSSPTEAIFKRWPHSTTAVDAPVDPLILVDERQLDGSRSETNPKQQPRSAVSSFDSRSNINQRQPRPKFDQHRSSPNQNTLLETQLENPATETWATSNSKSGSTQ